MSKCVYCLKEIGDKYQECPFCGFPVSVPFTVKNVKQKWKQDMFAKQFKVEPSLDAIHRAEKLEQEGGNQQHERAPQRTPPRPPQRSQQPPQRPNPQQPWGQAPQYPQNAGGYPQQPGYGYPQYPGQYPQYPQYPQAPQYPQQQYPQYPQSPAQNEQWGNTQQPAWDTPPSKPEQQKPPIPSYTAPTKQSNPARSYDAELFNDWLT